MEWGQYPIRHCGQLGNQNDQRTPALPNRKIFSCAPQQNPFWPCRIWVLAVSKRFGARIEAGQVRCEPFFRFPGFSDFAYALIAAISG
jgi:hypothetical protein